MISNTVEWSPLPKRSVLSPVYEQKHLEDHKYPPFVSPLQRWNKFKIWQAVHETVTKKKQNLTLYLLCCAEMLTNLRWSYTRHSAKPVAKWGPADTPKIFFLIRLLFSKNLQNWLGALSKPPISKLQKCWKETWIKFIQNARVYIVFENCVKC